MLTRPPRRFDERMALRADLGPCDGLELDLVLLNDAPIVLTREIADAGQCLFARTSDDEVDFVTRASTRFWDFQPFRERAWTFAGERAVDRLHGPWSRVRAGTTSSLGGGHLAARATPRPALRE